MSAVHTAFIFAGMTLAGCATVIGLGDYAEDAAVGGGGEVGTGGDAAGGESGVGGGGGTVMLDSCGDATTPSVCTAEPPAGFEGPVVLSASAAVCGAAWSEATVSGAMSWTADPAICSCGCNVAADWSCDRMEVTQYDETDCAGTTFTTDYPAVQCTIAGGKSFGSARGAVLSTPGTCSADAAPPQRPTVTYDDHAVCGLPAPPTQSDCGDGRVCVPEPDDVAFGRVCILAREDVAACPADYAQRFELAANATFTDTRDCSTCDCPADAPPQCTGTARYAAGASCGATYALVPSDGTCVNPGVVAEFSQLEVTISVVSPPVCVPMAGSATPIGDVTPAESYTVCCTPLITN